MTCLCTVLGATPVVAQLRIVTYNTATDTNVGDTPRAGMSDVLNLMGTVAVPEPASVVLGAVALAALVGVHVRGRCRKQSQRSTRD